MSAHRVPAKNSDLDSSKGSTGTKKNRGRAERTRRCPPDRLRARSTPSVRRVQLPQSCQTVEASVRDGLALHTAGCGDEPIPWASTETRFEAIGYGPADRIDPIWTDQVQSAAPFRIMSSPLKLALVKYY